MKKIETLYALMNEDSGEEAIVGFSGESGPLQMQCASADAATVQAIQIICEAQNPLKKFWISKFERIYDA